MNMPSWLRQSIAALAASATLIALAIGAHMPFVLATALAAAAGISLWLLLSKPHQANAPALSETERRKQDIATATKRTNYYINAFGKLQSRCKIPAVTRHIAEIIVHIRNIRSTFADNYACLSNDTAYFEEYAHTAHTIVENYIHLSDLREQEPSIREAERLIAQLPNLFQDLYKQRREQALIELEVHNSLLQEMQKIAQWKR